jgi:hypothetical protein
VRSGVQKGRFKTSAERDSQPADGKPRSKFDTWLQRSAQIAQITLVIAAIAGYFYSVRPIHQKQRLDEEIALRTSELAAVRSRVQSTYSNLRKFVVFDLRRFVYLTCTGLLDDPELPRVEKKPWVEILDRDAPACIMKEGMNSHKLEDLTPDDVAKLKIEFGRIADRVTLLRSEAKAEITRLESIPPDSLPAEPTPKPGSMRAVADDILRMTGRPVDYNSPEVRLTIARENVAKKYRDNVGAELDKINDIHWDSPAQNN